MTATTWNPSDKAANATLSNGNLTVTTTTTPYSAARSTTSKSSTGKYVFEVKLDAVGGVTAFAPGLGNSSATLTSIPGIDANGFGWSNSSGAFFYNASQIGKSLGTITVNTVFMWAIDLPNKNAWVMGPNGLWNGTVGDDPATNTGGLNGSAFYNGSLNTVMGTALFAMTSVYDNSKGTANFGASAFHYTAPSGFTAWDVAAPVETSTATMSFAGISLSGLANDDHAAGTMAFTKASFSGAASRVETSTATMAFAGISISGTTKRMETGTASMAFAGISLIGHTNDDHVTGGMAFSGVNFSTRVNVHSAAGLMTFAGISLSGSTHEASTAAGLMAFAGIGINGAVTRVETGAGAMHFTGISMAGIATRVESASGLMSFTGLGIRGSVFDYPPAGFGRRSSWTYGA